MLFDAPDFDGHELVLFGRDKDSGLSAIIAVHSTALGPACGGCRMWPYAGEADAVRDVLRLSRGMSFKNAMAGLPLGGGKSVIIADSRRDKSDALFRAFGRVVESLGGRYVAAEDVGITVADVMVMGQTTRHVAGLSHGAAASGDPSPFTARGVYLGLTAAVAHRLGSDSLKGLRIAVQGLGNVGMNLCRHLAEEGAQLVVGDIQPHLVRQAEERFGAAVADPATLHRADVDVFAPCALGAILNEQTVAEMKARVVAGAANNQLATDDVGGMLQQAGILYAPDYVINAGGIINVAAEVTGNYDQQQVIRQVDRIPATLADIFRRSGRDGKATNVVADDMARDLLSAGRTRRLAAG